MKLISNLAGLGIAIYFLCQINHIGQPQPVRIPFPSEAHWIDFHIPEMQKGYNAYWQGSDVLANPYNDDREPGQYESWRDGWYSARQQNVDAFVKKDFANK